MAYHRLILIICVLAFAICLAGAATLSSFRLPTQHFNDWSVLQDDCTDSSLVQIWRQPLADLPKGADGYLMVSYQVAVLGSPEQVANQATKLLTREQFSSYIGMGYEVSTAPWPKCGLHGMIATVQGMDQHTAKARRADIYTCVLAHDTYLIWLQVRQASSANDLPTADRALKNAGGNALADEVATYLLTQWASPKPAPSDMSAPATTTPQQTNAAATPATTNTSPASPVAPPVSQAVAVTAKTDTPSTTPTAESTKSETPRATANTTPATPVAPQATAVATSAMPAEAQRRQLHRHRNHRKARHRRPVPQQLPRQPHRRPPRRRMGHAGRPITASFPSYCPPGGR